MPHANALEVDWGVDPWRKKSTLQRLYVDEGKSVREIADELGCSDSTVRYWMQKFDIPRRGQTTASRLSQREEYATHRFTNNGYERWVTYYEGERPSLWVHQLLACLEYDPHEVFDPNTDVHHVTGHGLDNRPEAIELLTASEHSKHHAEADPPECKHRLLQSAKIMSEERA